MNRKCNPCELNVAVTAIANYLYSNLSKSDFLFLNVFLSELSKTMFSMEIFKGICKFEKKLDAKKNDK